MNPTCPQTETTLAWLYGEGDEAHLAHVGACPECQALVAEHEEVLAIVAPVMDEVSRPVPVDASAAPSIPVPSPANRSMGPMVAALFALAAAALLVFGIWSSAPPEVVQTAEISSPPVPVASVDFPEDLDLGLDDLDAEIDDLFADLEAL